MTLILAPTRLGEKRQRRHRTRALRKRRALLIGRLDCLITYLVAGGGWAPSSPGAEKLSLNLLAESDLVLTLVTRPGRLLSLSVFTEAGFESAPSCPCSPFALTA